MILERERISQRRLDLDRVAVAGHSRGCKAAFRTARVDERVTACLILDDPPPPAERAGAPARAPRDASGDDAEARIASTGAETR